MGVPEHPALRGAVGVLSPVGVVVVSPKGVQLLPVPKGPLEQLLGVFTPVILQVLKVQQEKKDPRGNDPAEQLTRLELLAALYSFLPPHGFKFGLFPWPLPLLIGFLVGWLALALIVGAFLPQQVTVIAYTLQESFLWTGVVGLLSYGVVLLLVVLLTVTLIGIPLTGVIIVVVWAIKLLGMVSIAFLIGQRALALFVPIRRRSVSAVQRIRYSEGLFILIGGVILVIVRMLPVLGWIIWLVLGIFGFGAVLRTQRQPVQ
jgi:hypothetical protein